MGWWQTITAALPAARESKRSRASAGGVLAVVLGWVLGRLAGRRTAVPPVRATGSTASAARPPDDLRRT
jgi:hypothetical protein